MRLQIAIASLLLPAAATAGGVSWPFTVEEFHRVSPEVVSFTLRPLRPGGDFPESCPLLSVTTRFEREPFWRRSWSRDQVTEATHGAALHELERAAKAHEPIRFGSMGTGLVPEASDPCVTQSKGLAVLEEGPSGESRAVYSFHNSI